VGLCNQSGGDHDKKFIGVNKKFTFQRVTVHYKINKPTFTSNPAEHKRQQSETRHLTTNHAGLILLCCTSLHLDLIVYISLSIQILALVRLFYFKSIKS